MTERKAKNTIVKSKADITIPGYYENASCIGRPKINPVELDSVANEKILGPSSSFSIVKTPANETNQTIIASIFK